MRSSNPSLWFARFRPLAAESKGQEKQRLIVRDPEGELSEFFFFFSQFNGTIGTTPREQSTANELELAQARLPWAIG